MNIVVIGSSEQAAECRLKFGETHAWTVCPDTRNAGSSLGNADVIFDFVSPDHPGRQETFSSRTGQVVFVDNSRARLSKLAGPWALNRKHVFGFCGLPTFINREILEVSLLQESDATGLAEACGKLGTAYEVVAEQAGMISPRVVCMIINEAYLTLEEGTATREDIDLAMKLGTNYPYGPFEWAERIGIQNVVRVLDAAYRDGGDERYRICPLLSAQAAGG